MNKLMLAVFFLIWLKFILEFYSSRILGQVNVNVV